MNRNWMRALLLTVCLTASGAGCHKTGKTEVASPPASWNVLKGGKKVLWVKDEPGPILSTATLPPGAKPATHSFLTATAFDANEEDNLRQLLDKSTDFNDYVAALKKNGYVLIPDSP